MAVAGLWFSPGTQVSSTNKTDRHDTIKMLLKVVLNTITIYFDRGGSIKEGHFGFRHFVCEFYRRMDTVGMFEKFIKLFITMYPLHVNVITSKVLRSPPWLGWPLWNFCVTNDHRCVSLVNTSRSFPHSWLITRFVCRITRLVPLEEQELPTLLEPQVFSRVRVTRSLVLCACFVDRSLFFCTFLAIVLSVLQFTDSNYPFGIFKLSLSISNLDMALMAL